MMEDEIEESERRLVIIADPHFRHTVVKSKQSQIYIRGKILEEKGYSIFVKDLDGNNYKG